VRPRGGGDPDAVASIGRMVRSASKKRVANHGAAPSFETRSFGPLLRMRRKENRNDVKWLLDESLKNAKSLHQGLHAGCAARALHRLRAHAGRDRALGVDERSGARARHGRIAGAPRKGEGG